jgi:1,2-phenylacetyl-CoA epoxidase catalytic subunit
MQVERTTLPRKYHEAVLHWRRHHFKDYEALLAHWDRYFPTDPPFCLCAQLECRVSPDIEVGPNRGRAKYAAPAEMGEEAARHLLGIIRAQASTEFGSIQQHQGTIDRAADDQDRFWVLRVMAEELRHGYQMFALLLGQDWSSVSRQSADDMIEEILSMQTGSHVLEAFNLDYDSFVDNVVFAALIDRVGKYQLTMQKVCAYKPFAQSMPPMLREEAFHLAAGVIPLRRWVERAARGDLFVALPGLQRAINKWLPRGLEMFGHEKGGDTNLRLGFKDKLNAEAQDLYYAECQRLVDDLNLRYVRARVPGASREQAEQVIDRLRRERGTRDGVAWEDLLRLPDARFFRRRGVPAFQMIGAEGETFAEPDGYLAHLARHLPEAYLASRDMRRYAETLRKVVAGELSVDKATKQLPVLKRVGGVCPCSRAVRWVVEEALPAGQAPTPAT